jgi:hypothetical protein
MIWLVLAFTLLGIPAHAQQASLVYICVEPDDVKGVPYLLTFRQTNLFGILIPEKANLTVYSQEGANVSLYGIDPDVQSGGYHRTNKIATAITRMGLPISRPCESQYPKSKIDLGALAATVPLPVSEDYVALIQTTGDNRLDSQPFLGVFSFNFPDSVPEKNTPRSFQVIQLDDRATGIEMSFPFIRQNTRLLLVGNKDVDVRRSFKDDDTRFSSPLPSDERNLLISQLNGLGLNLFSIMKDGQVRIYPSSGLIIDYQQGGFLRLDIAPSPAGRDPLFVKGMAIHPLEGAEANYYLLSQPKLTYGKLSNTTGPNNVDTAIISREVDNSGRLFITDPKGKDDVFVESWLVEVGQ